jgi:beta-mannosidase
VWHEGKPFSAYLLVNPRFCSEFGYQSLPSERMVSRYATPDQRNATSPVMEHHQRHPRGNTIIVENMLHYFRMPTGFREMLYLSQAQQALAIKTAVEYWRSLRPRCMGALYWQLNDVWPVASWSSLEYDGGWKLLHYEAKRFFEPLHLALIVKDERIEACVCNDCDESFSFDLVVRLRHFDGTVVGDFTVRGKVSSDSAVTPWSLPIFGLPQAPNEIFAEAQLVAEGFAREKNNKTPLQYRRAFSFLTEPKRCPLVDSRLSCNVEATSQELVVRIKAEAPAFWVSLDTFEELVPGNVPKIQGRFEDSGFNLLAGEERVVRFIPAKEASLPSVGQLQAALRVMDLFGSSM